jgi:tRNA(Ile)-lysidine synthase
MRSLEKRVLDYIGEKRLISPGDRVAVAVSGGADSVALLRILHDGQAKLGVKLLVAHFDHCLRGAESDADAEFVGGLARTYGLPFVLDREDVASAAKRNKWNLEDAARRLRYTFFERLIREGQANRIAVAHTADDQAETVLAHLIRGTGPTGLGGIYPVAGKVVRPLLAARREELQDYLRERGQSWREDASNLDTRRLRARIRSRLVPMLEREFSPRIVERLDELAQLSREEQKFWNALTDDRFKALVRRNGTEFSIRASDLLAPMALPSALQAGRADEYRDPLYTKALTERLVRRIYEELRGSRQGLSAAHVEQVIRLAANSGGGHFAELPRGVLVEKSFGGLKFTIEPASRSKSGQRLNRRLSPDYAYRVELPERGCATVCVPELNSRIRLKVIDWTYGERETINGRLALDTALLRMPLTLRNWRPGDAYRPLGRREIHKLKHMFAEGRVPVRERPGWPVLESAGQVVWARGMAPAREFCARSGTVNGVVIEEERL